LNYTEITIEKALAGSATAKVAFVDAIGGWKTSGVGHGYGYGYPLEVLEKWREKL